MKESEIAKAPVSGAFLFMADAHVTRRTWTNSTVLSGDAYRALDLLAGKLKAECAPWTLVIGGDWFDTNRPSSDDVVRTMAFLRLFGRVLFITGNHDNTAPSFLEADRSDEGHEVRMLDRATHGTATLYGIPWHDDRNAVRCALSSVSMHMRDNGVRHAYIVMHAAFRHLLDVDGAWQLEGDDVSRMFKGLEATILVGHVHRRDTTVFGGNVTVHSPGSLYPRSADTMHRPCSVTLVDTDTRRLVDVPVDCRLYERMEWTCQKDVDDTARRLLAETPEDWMPPYLLVELPPKSDVHPSFPDGVRMQVTYKKPKDRAESPAAGKPVMTLEDAVREECDDEDMADMAVTLLRSDDPIAEMDKWLDGWKVERLE